MEKIEYVIKRKILTQINEIIQSDLQINSKFQKIQILLNAVNKFS